MSYAKELAGLELIEHDKYIDAIRRNIDHLGAKMESLGYSPIEVRRFFREMLVRFAGRRCAEYVFDLVVAGWLDELIDDAEERYDRSRFTNSFGLLWTLVFSEGGAAENCRWKVDNVWVPATTEAELRELRVQAWEKCRKRFPQWDIPLSAFVPDES